MFLDLHFNTAVIQDFTVGIDANLWPIKGSVLFDEYKVLVCVYMDK